MTEVCREETKQSPTPLFGGGANKSTSPARPGAAACVKDRARGMDFAGGAALVTPRAPTKKAPTRDDRNEQAPGDTNGDTKKEPNDERDPKACSTDAAETPLTESADDRPDDVALAKLCASAARDSRQYMQSVLTQRLAGFCSAASYLEDSAAALNEAGAVLAFIEKAFGIAASALIGIGLAGMATKGAVGFLKSLLAGSLNEGARQVGSYAKGKAQDGKVSFADFQASQFEAIAQLDTTINHDWNEDDLVVRFMNEAYPHRAAAATLAATRSMSEAAFELQRTTTIASWTNLAHETKGGDVGVLVFDIAFAPDGSYRIEGAELGGMGKSFKQLLERSYAVDPKKEEKQLTLGDVLRAPGAGLRVKVQDQSQAIFDWDTVERRITTPDAQLMHHKVMAWTAKHVGPDVAAAHVGAHRFVFEVLGAKTFASLGIAS